MAAIGQSKKTLNADVNPAVLLNTQKFS